MEQPHYVRGSSATRADEPRPIDVILDERCLEIARPVPESVGSIIGLPKFETLRRSASIDR
jgi:hypothetical protein